MALLIEFTKMHGLGNDFVVIDNSKYQHIFTTSQIKFICDRKIGIGCDQLLVIEQLHDHEIADFEYKIYNQDGSLAKQCGNGARCITRYIADHYRIQSPIRFKTETQVITGTIISPTEISVSMGQPQFLPQEIPFAHEPNLANQYTLVTPDSCRSLSQASIGDRNDQKLTVTFGVVSVGNPHAVVELKHASELNDMELLQNIAHLIQNSGLFPEGVNVNFFVKLDKQHLRLVTYERGVGFTLACGSGACASACFAIQQAICSTGVVVSAQGGDIKILWEQPNPIIMTGNAKTVFAGAIEL